MPSLRDCIGKVGKRLSPADAEAMHARAKQYLADGHPVEKAEKMAVDFSLGEAQKQLDSIYKQAGVKRGAKAATQKAAKVEPDPKIASRPLGGEITIKTPDDAKIVVKGKWRVVDESELISSKDPAYDAALQPRDRERAASTQQITTIATKLDPELLTNSVTTDTGAPIIDSRGMVLSGNGRTEAIRKAYGASGERAAQYKKYLIDNAQELGLKSEDISKISKPVLVREISDYGGLSKEDFARRSNRQQVLGMSDSENATADANFLIENPDVFQLFNPDESGDVLAASNRDFINKFIEATGDRAELISKDGQGYNVGKLVPRIRNAVLGAVIGPENRSMLDALIEDNEGVKRVANGLLNSASKLVKIRGTEYDLGPDIARAVQDILAIRQTGETPANFLAQTSLFGDGERSANADFIFLQIGNAKSAKAIAEFFNAYADAASKIDTTTSDMFGEANATPAELLKRVTDRTAQEGRQENLTLGKPASENVKAEPEVKPVDEGGKPSQVKGKRPPKGSSSSLTDEAASAIVAREKEGREVIARWQAANPKAPKTVTIVNDPNWTENGRGVKGQFADGKLTINLAYAPDEASIVDTANHEWAHDTLSSNEGRMAIATFATRELPATDLSDLARKYPKQSGESTVDHRIRLAEEWVAKNAEKNPAVWKRIVESIKAWLQRHGMTTLTNEEAARALLRALRVNLPSGPRGGARSSVGERTDTPAFRAWFGGSKVVDENGKPKVVYHGTGSEFDAFDTSLEGAHFGTEEQAHRRLGNKSFEPGAKNTRNGRLVAAYLSIKNPMRVPDLGTWKFGGVVRELRFDGAINAAEADRAYEEFNKSDDAGWNELKQILKGKGYDGFVYENQQEGEGDSYVAFYPTQIKSASGNRGTFDPNNPDIRYSVYDEGPSLGIKNAAVEQQRSDWNLPPPKERHGMAYEEARSEAKARFDADPFVGQKLVEELSANPRAPTGVENLILDHELVRLHNERNAAEAQFVVAAKSKDAAQMALAEARINAARDAFERTMDVADAVGTKSSESLYLRKAMLKEDYSLAALERKMKQANGGEDLTKAQEEEVRKIHEKYQATLKTLEAKLAQVETERAKAVLDVELLKIIKGVAAEPKAQRNKEADDKYYAMQAAAAEKRLAGKKTFDHADLNSYAIYAANLRRKQQPKTMAKSALTDETISSYPPEFERDMVARFGEHVRPHLKEIWARSDEAVPLMDSQVPGTRNVKGERKTTKEKIKDRIEEGDNVEDLGIYVQKLAEQFVREGITEREALVTAVHKELNGLGLEISRRDTMDAISGYGKFKPLDQDEVKATLRDLKGQMQQVGKLEDMAKGQAPAKTGVERRTPTDEERRLIQQVEEAKRKGGFNVTDPVKQLKSALDAIKTRLKNSIADLDYQIATGQQTVKEKTGTPYDAEAAALRERRNELKKQYDEIFGQSELTDEQRIAMAEKAADSQIAELERQLRTNEVFAKQQAQPLNSPALEAKRARIAALKEERYYARQLLQPRADPKTRDEIALQAYKTATAKRIAELQERLARGDFAPRAKPPERVLDTEALRLKALHEKVKTEFHEALIHERMKRRTMSQKVFDKIKETINLPRTVMSSGDVSAVLRQGGFIAFGNPKRAAQSIGPMFKALGSEEQSIIIEQEILNDPYASLYKKHKLYIAPHKVLTLAAMEEQQMSRFAKRIPGVNASNRAYITFLNLLRRDSFNAMYEAMTPEQQKNPKNVDAIASFINVATGRGNLGKASGMAENLATVFFSPRLLASRFQLLAGTPAMRGDKETRKMIRKEYVKFLTGLAVILGLGAMAGADIEKDPRSTDFLKLRFGNTRLDVLGGLGQVTTLVTRLLSGETKNAKGEIKPIRGNVDYGATDSIKVMTNFIRSKLSPSIGAAVNIARGETMTGQEVTPTNQTLSLAMPLSFQDIGEAFQAQGPAAGSALAALSLFGFGLQQYGADIEGISSDLRRTLNDAGLSAPNPDRPQVGPPNKKRWASDAEYARYQKEVAERFTTLMTGRKAMLEKMPNDKAQELVTKMMEISRKSAHDRLDRYAR